MGIREDKAFRAEKVPPNLQKLIDDLREFFALPGSHIGCKGDANHTRGYHRSRRFLQTSRYAGSRRYSVVEPANREGDDDWLSGIDISLDNARLVAMCRRLDWACRAGKLDKIAEWYGNLGGDNRVDGYNNIRNVLATSDSSHLWHAHISIFRKYANDDHSDIFAVLTGQETATAKDDDMDPDTPVKVPTNAPFPGYLGKRAALPAGELWHSIYYRVNATDKKLDKLTDTIEKLTGAVTKLTDTITAGNTGGKAK